MPLRRVEQSPLNASPRPPASKERNPVGPHVFLAAPQLATHFLSSLRHALQTWSSYQLGHSLATLLAEISTHGVNSVPLLVFVQRLASLLKTYVGGQQLSLNIIFHYLVLQYGTKPEWLMMLTMAFEMRAVVLVLDGIDEASGRRDDIQDLVLNVLVRMGQRLITTSRPEGVKLERFKATFVIISLEPLSEEQAKKAIDQQMQELQTGQEFSYNLLQFLSIRKEHDRIWRTEAFRTDEERSKVEALLAPDRFLVADPAADAHKDADGKVYDPLMRQYCTEGSRVIQLRQDTVRSSYWKELTVVLEPVLGELDGVLKHLGEQVTDEALKMAVGDMLVHRSTSPPPQLLNTVASRLCLVARGEKIMPSILAGVIRARTDELYEAVEDLQPLFKLVDGSSAAQSWD